MIRVTSGVTEESQLCGPKIHSPWASAPVTFLSIRSRALVTDVYHSSVSSVFVMLTPTSHPPPVTSGVHTRASRALHILDCEKCARADVLIRYHPSARYALVSHNGTLPQRELLRMFSETASQMCVARGVHNAPPYDTCDSVFTAIHMVQNQCPVVSIVLESTFTSCIRTYHSLSVCFSPGIPIGSHSRHGIGVDESLLLPSCYRAAMSSITPMSSQENTETGEQDRGARPRIPLATKTSPIVMTESLRCRLLLRVDNTSLSQFGITSDGSHQDPIKGELVVGEICAAYEKTRLIRTHSTLIHVTGCRHVSWSHTQSPNLPMNQLSSCPELSAVVTDAFSDASQSLLSVASSSVFPGITSHNLSVRSRSLRIVHARWALIQ